MVHALQFGIGARFRQGSSTHPDAATRRAAIDLGNRAAAATQARGAAWVRQDALPAQRIAQALLLGGE